MGSLQEKSGFVNYMRTLPFVAVGFGRACLMFLLPASETLLLTAKRQSCVEYSALVIVA